MSEAERKDDGPDLSLGVSAADFPFSGLLRGHVGDDAVLLARSGEEYFAVGASCPHYGASLPDGVLVDDTVRCPWHHACFSLRTGEAIRAPAFDALACWQVEQRDGKIFITAKKTALTVDSDRAVSLSRQPSRSSLWAVVLPALLQRRCCADPAINAAYLCSARIPTFRWTGPTCPRTTSPALRRKSGCRSSPRAGIATMASICALTLKS